VPWAFWEQTAPEWSIERTVALAVPWAFWEQTAPIPNIPAVVQNRVSALENSTGIGIRGLSGMKMYHYQYSYI